MKTAKKIAVLFAALVMTLAMSATVFATETNPTATGSITLTKGMVVKNATLAQVDGPGVTFTYAVAGVAPSAANGGTTVSDGVNSTNVTAGVAGGVSLSSSTIAFPVGTPLNASAAGADNQKTITASGDISVFTAPGVYRYEITEAASGNTNIITNAGATMYLDVYVVNGTNGLEFAGFVMHDASGAKVTFDDTDPSGNSSTSGPTSGQSILKSAAEFDTVNVTLSKSVVGTLGDKNNQFPFAGTVVDNARSFSVHKGTGADTSVAGAASGSAISTTLADGETYYISGLSKAATVAYTETNNTNDTYTVNYTGGTASAVAPAGTKAMPATAVSSASAVTFTNSLDAVSPTGVILRFGAPLLVLAAAVALFVLNRKSRTTEN